MNIFNEFKTELGYTDVGNQYIEMLSLSFIKEHCDILEDNGKLSEFSKALGINLCATTDDLGRRIAWNYIVNIHASFAKFLDDYLKLDGAPSINTYNDKSLLKKIINCVYENGVPDEVNVLCQICEYYRMVRNLIIHSDISKPGSKGIGYREAKGELFGAKYQKIKNEFYGKLNAPNEIENIRFDDQVLFSKAALSLAKHIFYDTHYRLQVLFDKNRDRINQSVCNFKHERKKRYLYKYFSSFYPIGDEYDKDIEELISSLS